ncbi:F-box/kelch-repeat protein At3g06240-like [Pyrus communis]|uniref:F-box/kelch-repeat protein At3g06240-like n=1 Tax=Pyrus communis TaxID=23211 RepID=UPI0035C00441
MSQVRKSETLKDRVTEMTQVRESETSEDRVAEILSRLPPKSLMRFKCIRKSWGTIINNPSFMAKHLSNSVDNKFSSSTCILLRRSQMPVFPDRSWKREYFWSMINLSHDSDEHNLYYDVEDLNIQFPLEDHDHVSIHGYCNGIVCLIVGKNAVLYNPATRELKQLPDSCLLLPSPPEGKFELESTFQGMGFGYDSKANEYKVVKIIENCKYDMRTFSHRIAFPHTAEVYVTTTNSWRVIEIEISSDTYNCSCSVYLKGLCYWFASDNEEYVLSFDLGDEIFHRIQLRYRKESGFLFYDLFLYNESIASFCSHYDNDNFGILEILEIWVMDNCDGVNSSWTKLQTLGPFKDDENLLTFWKSNELLMVTSDKRAISYNSSTGNLKYIHIPPIINKVSDFEALIYVESIVPV